MTCLLINFSNVVLTQPVWAAACQVVVEEIRVRQGSHGDGELAAVFERGFAAMRAYAGSCPLMCTLSSLFGYYLPLELLHRLSYRKDTGSVQHVGWRPRGYHG